MPADSDKPHRDPEAPEKLNYEPWPQRRRTPIPVKVLIWAAIIIHALGIIPAIGFLWYVATEERRLIDLMTGGACCFPIVALVAIGLFLVLMKAGESEDR